MAKVITTELQHSGASSANITLDSSGNTTIEGNLTVDGTSNVGIGGATGGDFNDNVKLRLGTGNDLEIYHDGSQSRIVDSGTGNLCLQTNHLNIYNAGSTETMAEFTENGAVNLYYDNVKKFETTSDSIKISGTIGEAGRTTSDDAPYWFKFNKSRGAVDSGTYVANADNLGRISAYGSNGTSLKEGFRAEVYVDGTANANEMPTGCRFYTLQAGNGAVITNKLYMTRDMTIYQNCQHGGSEAYTINRQVADGTLMSFQQGAATEGNIAVSGSTVSYNGGHLSRWSQIEGVSETDKSARPTIYQGTVMSNLDELCVWNRAEVKWTAGDPELPIKPETGEVDLSLVGTVKRAAYTEENQQLNKTKVSAVEGDKDVAGVFWTWDDVDDEIVNDYYLAMTGDMVIRVAGSTSVSRGDLLISAGDGTAKPQTDDIIRSNTIAKIISTNSTATYADGSKAYPCVLMAC